MSVATLENESCHFSVHSAWGFLEDIIPIPPLLSLHLRYKECRAREEPAPAHCMQRRSSTEHGTQGPALPPLASRVPFPTGFAYRPSPSEAAGKEGPQAVSGR